MEDVGDLFGQLRRAYGEPHRYYHTDRHIAECLQLLNRFAHVAERPDEIAVAIWFHDAVYDTKRSDNEQRSAEWAHCYLSAAAIDADCVSRVCDMIVATKDHESSSLDGCLMLDIDLGIFGAEREVFDGYDQAIRQEYLWVPEAQYRAARSQRLRCFLDLPRIFQTDEFHGRYESRARENLLCAIARLE